MQVGDKKLRQRLGYTDNPYCAQVEGTFDLTLKYQSV
jgi:hypothetical protein